MVTQKGIKVNKVGADHKQLYIYKFYIYNINYEIVFKAELTNNVDLLHY